MKTKMQRAICLILPLLCLLTSCDKKDSYCRDVNAVSKTEYNTVEMVCNYLSGRCTDDWDGWVEFITALEGDSIRVTGFLYWNNYDSPKMSDYPKWYARHYIPLEIDSIPIPEEFRGKRLYMIARMKKVGYTQNEVYPMTVHFVPLYLDTIPDNVRNAAL